MLKPSNSYDEIYNSFKWEIPEYYNMGVDVCDKHAHQRYRLALIFENEKGEVEKYTFWDLKRLTNQFANTLKAHGIGKGDRVGILLPQCPETGISQQTAKPKALSRTMTTLTRFSLF
jgi:acetyl-CoA synthetase